MGVRIIAEIGVNHNGSRELAEKMILAAKESGADSVKIQIFKTEEMVTRFAEKAQYQQNSGNMTENQFEMLKKYELGVDDIKYLQDLCRFNDLDLIATPFDFYSLEIMERLSFQTIKIGSGDITNIPLLKRVNNTGKNVIISTGMSNLGEIEEALSLFSSQANVSLLHCTSNYPTKPEDVNLRAITTLKSAFQKKVGYSDHTMSIDIPLAAVAMGAEIIEKHFTLDCNLPGPDHKASLEPFDFAKMVESIRRVELALGDGVKKCLGSEIEIKKIARKSITAKRDINAGDLFTEDNLAVKRPGTGLHPRYLDFFIGKRAAAPIKKDQQLDFGLARVDA